MHFTLGLALAVSAALGGSSLQTTISSDFMPKAQTVEEYTRDYFVDIPVMVAIAGCESHFRQFDKNGNVLKNPNSTAVGVFQIMASIHQESADENLNINIMTIEGNAAYARHLYEEKGTKPWNSSKACWSKTDTTSKTLAIVAINK
ncbi:hypothetical protein H7X87_04060 [Acetobacteraceae bacterium]|nr:hypothetical protein [Candidatus Parcubacteria bacterium]